MDLEMRREVSGGRVLRSLGRAAGRTGVARAN